MDFPAGLKITIDPGHGGEKFGAVSPEGIKEKDINLKVALKLASILENSGVSVLLTRKVDKDVPLEERTKMAEEFGSHIFISIHHNSSPECPQRINKSEFYFPMEPSSPSSDLAWNIYEIFEKKFVIPVEKPLPARYKVLKNNIPLSTLTEAFYLSYPDIEREINKGILGKEAELIFEGIKTYLERGLPLISSTKILGTRFFATIKDLAGKVITPLGVRLRFDDRPLNFDLRGEGKLSARVPIFIKNGNHRISLQVTNVLGQRSQFKTVEYSVSRPPISFSLSSYPRNGKNPALISITLHDEFGYPIASGETVAVRLDSGKILASNLTTDEDGKVKIVAHFKETSKVFISSRGFEGFAQVQVEKHWVYPHFVGKVLNSLTGEPLEGAEIELGGKRTASDLGGYFFLEIKGEIPSEIKIKKIGFLTQESVVNEVEKKDYVFRLKPLFKGVFLNKKILLDPQPESESSKITEYNLIDLNYHVAEILSSLIERAGGKAEILGARGPFLSPVDRLKKALRGFDFYLIIGHHLDDFISISFYEPEKDENVVNEFYSTLGLTSPDKERKKIASSDYRLINLPRLRLKVIFPHRDKKKDLLDELSRYNEAYALFSALLRIFDYREGVPFTLKLKDSKDKPLIKIPWIWEGFPGVLSSSQGNIRVLYIPPGEQNFTFFMGGEEINLKVNVQKNVKKEITLPPHR